MITLTDVAGQTHLIFGFGKSGQATALALKTSGANILVWDDKDSSRHAATDAGYCLADPEDIPWSCLDSLVLSPGIPLSHQLIEQARQARIPILCDLDFLFRACPQATYIGVTGTNGKSTTTALITHILTSSGRKAQAGGNIGTPALALTPMDQDGVFVLELSSYQLALMTNHPLSVAVLLNITPDHLDHHEGMDGYILAKKRILQPAEPQTLILGTDETETRDMMREIAHQPNLTVQEISSRHPVAQGVQIKDQTICPTDGVLAIDLSLCKTLPGTHNAQNAAAAYAACRALSLSPAEIENGLQSFSGLVHRQQLVATLRGVRFINDSKATNADATSKALAPYAHIYWIAGGLPKEGGLSGLEPLMDHVTHAFLIGQAEDAFAAWCEGKVAFTRCGNLEKAVALAAKMAWQDRANEPCVLLSPACASFDQFKSFEQRGDAFISLVHTLSIEDRP